MYLKKIISSGFKSFADRVTITLDKKHISGIVGPNGSGKSNVIDAVRWVMGEQNAKMLRGEKATDIIFAGSERRKPLGMAEVTLIFDNSEGSTFCPPEYRHEAEIALTRRLYADGGREYLINNKACRLKDIVGFFSATGLGGRSYSMIQQGQVDRILQAKPEQIREILEEAAGTLVFKQRRHEATKKLENTRLNLSRIDDILTEVERQRTALADQVDKAKTYKEMAAELQELETALLRNNYFFFRRRKDKIHREVESMATEDSRLVADLSQLEVRQLELQQLLDEADPEVQKLNEEITVLREQIARDEASLLNALQLIEGGDARLEAMSKDIQEEADHLEGLEQESETARAQLTEAEERASTIAIAMESMQERLEESDERYQIFHRQIEEFEDESRNLERLIQSNGVRKESLAREFSDAERRRREKYEKLTELETDLSQADILVDAARVKVSGKRKGLDAELEKKRVLENQISESEESLIDLTSRRDDAKESYISLNAKIESLEMLLSESDDLGAKFHEVVEGSDGLHGAMLLSDHLSFSERKDELPQKARTALEKWVDRVAVTSVNQLNRMVEVAHQHQVSGFPVLVLDQLQSQDDSAITKWKESYDAEPLADFFRLESESAELRNLVGRLYHIPAREVETDFAETLPEGIVVFTASGVFFGSSSEYQVEGIGGKGILSRKSELEEKKHSVKAAQGSLAAIQGEIDVLEAKRAESRLALRDLDQHLHSQNSEVMAQVSELNSLEQKADHKRELMVTAREEADELQEKIEAFGDETEKLVEHSVQLEKELQQTKDALEETRVNAQEVMDERQELTRQLESHRLEAASASSRSQALTESFERSSQQLENVRMKMTRRYDERSRLQEEIALARTNHEKLQADIETHVLRRQELEEKASERKEENAEIIEEMRTIDSRLKEAREAKARMQKTLSSHDVELERLRSAMENNLEQAQEKYHLNLAEEEGEEDPEMDASAVGKKVSRLRNKLDGMGLINMMAIEEYEELGERQTFMTRQREEIVSSVDLLGLAIDEIEITSRDKFLATFYTLNEEFKSLFPILFPNGEAQIVLTDPDKPLEAGVEILVRLPGKKQQNMRLFSGGEKALTAIALIFALLKSKPTPFCFLDEVDAPLDETNVGRYNRVLQALADRFQFIVITHNRRTMEVLDTLYGVTMQEPGVSKVVGVDMTKEIPAHLKKAFKDQKAGERSVQGAVAST